MKAFIIILLLISSAKAQTTFAVLNGSASTNASSYSWRQISGAASLLRAPNSSMCMVDSLTAGTRLFELTCSNPLGISKDSVKIIVKAAAYSCTITYPIYGITYLSWITTAESNVSYFLIERSYNGSTFYFVTKTTARGYGSSRYKIFLAKTARKYTYRLRAIYKNGKPGPITNFK